MRFILHSFVLIFTLFVLRIIWKLSELLYNWFVNLFVGYLKKRKERKLAKKKKPDNITPTVSRDFALQYQEIIKERIEENEREQAQ